MKKLLPLLVLLSTNVYSSTFSATYHVPATDSELEEVSHFVISDVTISREEGKENLQFILPEGLVGPNRKVTKMIKTFSPIPLVSYYKGEGVGATCIGLKIHKLVCRFKGYEDLRTNFADIKEYWENKGASDLEVEKRLQVAERFSSEPIGKLILIRK